MMQTVVTAAELIQKQIVMLQKGSGGTKMSNNEEISKIRAVLLNYDEFRAQKSINVKMQLEALENIEQRVTACLQSVNDAEFTITSVEQFKKWIQDNSIALRFEDKVNDGLIEDNKKIIDKALQAINCDNALLEELDKEITGVYQNMM